MKKALVLLLAAALLALPMLAHAQGYAAFAPASVESTPRASPAPGQTAEQGDARPDIGLYILISLFPIMAVVVGVFWVIRFKEKHIDGK